MKAYLSGAISHDKNQGDWKEVLINKLPEIEYLDPFDQELYYDYVNARAQGIEATRDFVRSNIIGRDLHMVDECDIVIVYVKRGVRIFGTVCEMFYAKYTHNKPILMVTELKYEEMNGWEIALADKIFSNINELIAYMREEYIHGYDQCK